MEGAHQPQGVGRVAEEHTDYAQTPSLPQSLTQLRAREAYNNRGNKDMKTYQVRVVLEWTMDCESPEEANAAAIHAARTAELEQLTNLEMANW